ncbi:MAG: hypothetical protein IPN75_04000 [Dechloromonas sp.]|uniref:Uncharacterized protein n=1 Tax=Candidatus Dechloromonas phosphorivorans TaxID=2899244 RepID=A0A9D7LM75_9RHOO|nr:hypothetical protein [Candidatus Dechloromonas phosphorivorans]
MDAHLLGVKVDRFRFDMAAQLKDGADLFQDSDFHNIFRRREIHTQFSHAPLCVNVYNSKLPDTVVEPT